MANRTPVNVDMDEVEKFNRMASRWWDAEGECKPLHDINPLRLQYILGRTALEGKRVLDVGCGGGILSEALAASGADVTAIDMAQASLTAAKHHSKQSGLTIDYRQITVEALADSGSDPFDVVTCMELLEHVPDPSSIVGACSRLAKPGGHVIFATLNRNFKSFVFAIIGAEYILRLLAPGTHQHKKFIKPNELAEWGEKAGLKMKDATGLSYNPFTRRYFLTQDTSVNYLIHFQK